MIEPHIIRTFSEVKDLHPGDVLLDRRGRLTRAKNIWPLEDLPAVVVTTKEHLRAASAALQEAINE